MKNTNSYKFDGHKVKAQVFLDYEFPVFIGRSKKINS